MMKTGKLGIKKITLRNLDEAALSRVEGGSDLYNGGSPFPPTPGYSDTYVTCANQGCTTTILSVGSCGVGCDSGTC
jgi:hypothetical protein